METDRSIEERFVVSEQGGRDMAEECILYNHAFITD